MPTPSARKHAAKKSSAVKSRKKAAPPKRVRRTAKKTSKKRRSRPRRIARDRTTRPTVVVFGAGITGLTVAHELVERGFRVQVVERERDMRNEYRVRVGGVAANQEGVIKADTSRLHPYLYSDENADYCDAVTEGRIDDEDTKKFAELLEKLGENEKRSTTKNLKSQIERIRQIPMARSRHRIMLPETLHFGIASYTEKELEILSAILEPNRARDAKSDPPKADEIADFNQEFLKKKDRRKQSNEVKLQAITKKIGRAIIRRADRFGSELQAAEYFFKDNPGVALSAMSQKGRPYAEMVAILLRREILAIKIRGQSRAKSNDLELLRARYVRNLLAERLSEYLRDTEPPAANGDGSGTTKEVAEEDAPFERVQEAIRDILGIGARAAESRAKQFADHSARHLIALSIDADRVSRSTRLGVDRRDVVDFRPIEVPLPGEHGYRYFPAYYRHLFDTMRRTPILDEFGDETIETAYDQLVTPASVQISVNRSQQPPLFHWPPDGTAKKHLIKIDRRQPRSIKEMIQAASNLATKIGLEPRDLAIFVLRILTFMTASKARRRVWQEQSWLSFLDAPGAEEPTTSPLSERFRDFHEELAIALLSMNAKEADAYSYGLNAVQLLLDYRGDGSGIDMTLNGPTSKTWLNPWKRYLRHQGVQFFQGEIVGLKAENGALLPVVCRDTSEPGQHDPNESYADRATRLEQEGAIRAPQAEQYGTVYHDQNGGNVEHKADFYVLALPFEQAGRLATAFERQQAKAKKSAKVELEGDWKKLAGMDALIPRDEQGRDTVQSNIKDPVDGTERDTSGKPKNSNTYPLRDLSGIQFFFQNNVRVGRGHIIHAGSEWGLTSIAQATHWRNRLSRDEGYLGQLSVDIGNFYRNHIFDEDRWELQAAAIYDDALIPPAGKELSRMKTPTSAWRSNWWELPARVWEQIIDSSELSVLDPPTYYHMDDGIVLRRRTTGGDNGFYPAENRTPFLINLPKQWVLRPGQVTKERGKPREREIETCRKAAEGSKKQIEDCRKKLKELIAAPSAAAGIDDLRNRLKKLESEHYKHLHSLAEAKRHKYEVGDIDYEVSHDRWVLAGTYMATHTRLMTMEACNESARHAVNAILDAIHEDGNKKYNSSGKQMGEPCEIFDPYNHEIDDFKPLKELDAELHKDGLPHFVDILGIDKMVEQLPRGGIEDKLEEASKHMVGITKLSNTIAHLYEKQSPESPYRKHFPSPDSFDGGYIRKEIERALQPIQAIEELRPLISLFTDALKKAK